MLHTLHVQLKDTHSKLESLKHILHEIYNDPASLQFQLDKFKEICSDIYA